jgi:phosphatidylserine/phosphatidylglycerophosphate/cardiolipin synthase-like enzyme
LLIFFKILSIFTDISFIQFAESFGAARLSQLSLHHRRGQTESGGYRGHTANCLCQGKYQKLIVIDSNMHIYIMVEIIFLSINIGNMDFLNLSVAIWIFLL